MNRLSTGKRIHVFWTSGSCRQRLRREGKLAFGGYPTVLLLVLYMPNPGTHVPSILDGAIHREKEIQDSNLECLMMVNVQIIGIP